MKKTIVCVSAYLMIVASSFKVAAAHEGTTARENETTEETASKPASSESQVANHIMNVYGQLDFKGFETLSFDVFKKAYNGYLNLLNAGRITNDGWLTICDFNLASTEPRM